MRYAYHFSLIFFYLFSVAGYHSSITSRMRGWSFPATNPLFNTTTTPPSLEREMEGVF